MTATSEFKLIPISDVHESPQNIRRDFNAAQMAELAKSIQEVGILTPCLVRPNAKGYELAAGHRRYRAAKTVKLESLPCVVRPMTDREFMEVLIIENLQRKDVNAMEEAEGYRKLVDKTGHTPETIATKVGKSISYVYQRLKLCELVGPAKQGLANETITAGHAILIARLQPKQQEEALKFCLEEGAEYVDGHSLPQAASVRALQTWIKETLMLDLHAAPFKKDDAMLHKAAGPCTSCPKRTGFNKQLFEDLAPQKDLCTDPPCYQTKLQAFFEQQKHKAAELVPGKAVVEVSTDWHCDRKGALTSDEWKEAKPESCGAVKPAVIVGGKGQGKATTVCTDTSCKVHRDKAERRDDRDVYKASQRRAEQVAKQKSLIRRRILDAILAKTPKALTLADLRLIAASFYSDVWHENQKRICDRFEIAVDDRWDPERDLAKIPDARVPELLLALSLVRETHVSTYGGSDEPKRLLATAKRYKVNAAAIEREAKKEAKAKKTKKVQTSAQTGGKAKKGKKAAA